MIKRVKGLQNDARINSEKFRDFIVKSESEILRGISTVAVLEIIRRHGEEGIYGYQLLKELEDTTKNMLVIEEGTLYPLLKKLEKDDVVKSEVKHEGGRPRKYYYITDEGKLIRNQLSGFFTKLVEAVGELWNFDVALSEELFYCPNCANRIDISAQSPDYPGIPVRFCDVCGLNIESYIKDKKKNNTTNSEELS